MDVPPIAGATPERLVSPPPSGPAPDTSRRLANIEAGLAELGERLDALAASLDASVRTAVAEEVRAASGDLRHTVSELGRLLVRDLGRLSKILAEHRDSIVADIRTSPPVVATPPVAQEAPPSNPSLADDEVAAAVYDGEAAAGDEPRGGGDDPEGGDSGERQRRPRLRRRPT